MDRPYLARCCMVTTRGRAHPNTELADEVAAVGHGAAFQRFRERLRRAHLPDVRPCCAIYRGTF